MSEEERTKEEILEEAILFQIFDILLSPDKEKKEDSKLLKESPQTISQAEVVSKSSGTKNRLQPLWCVDKIPRSD